MIAKYMKHPRLFLEIGTIGLGAVVGTLGQHIEKGRWDHAAEVIPELAEMLMTPTQVRLDDGTEFAANTLLVTISNAPRAGAGLNWAPAARMDDGLLDVRVYQDLDQAALVGQLIASLPEGLSEAAREQLWQARARSIEIHTDRPMPVSIESKLVGVTPARCTTLPGALSVIVGETDALLHPAAPEVVEASRSAASMLANPPAAADGMDVLSSARSAIKRLLH
jgi:diacylglycerol kinase family enzyme